MKVVTYECVLSLNLSDFLKCQKYNDLSICFPLLTQDIVDLIGAALHVSTVGILKFGAQVRHTLLGAVDLR